MQCLKDLSTLLLFVMLKPCSHKVAVSKPNAALTIFLLLPRNVQQEINLSHQRTSWKLLVKVELPPYTTIGCREKITIFFILSLDCHCNFIEVIVYVLTIVNDKLDVTNDWYVKSFRMGPLSISVNTQHC